MSNPAPANHYADHLAVVNETNAATVSENIYNEQGSLIIAKGHKITPEIAHKIAQHKLVQPLENSIALENFVSSDSALEQVHQYAQQLGLSDLLKTLDIDDQVKVRFSNVKDYPVVLQKLTVLSERFPKTFQQSITRSVAALAICIELKLDDNTTNTVFLSCLLSDTGLLHIDPAVVQKEGAYSSEEWSLMQGHVVIARKFAEMVPGLPKRVARAIFEHHERIDGFGYPMGKRGDELCLEGQVVSLTETISALYRKHVREKKYGISTLIPILQVNHSAFDGALLNAAIRLLKRDQPAHQRAYADEDMPSLLDSCIQQQQRLANWFNRTEELAQIYQRQLQTLEGSKSLAMYEKLRQMIITSGMLSTFHTEWLEATKIELSHNDYEAIELCAIILEELHYQCQFLERHIEQEFKAAQNKLADFEVLLKDHYALTAMLRAG